MNEFPSQKIPTDSEAEGLVDDAKRAELFSSEIQVTRYSRQLSELVPEDLLQDLEGRLPRLEQTVYVEMTVFPKGATPIACIHPSFQPIIVACKNNADIVGVASGGASGANIHSLKERLTFPTRKDEYDYFLNQHPKYAGDYDIYQFQVGGWPFNDGSAFFSWEEDEFVTQDGILANKLQERFKQRRLIGIAVDHIDRYLYAELTVDTSDPTQFAESLNVYADQFQYFIGSPGLLVENGKTCDLKKILDHFNGDPRHFLDLPYFGGLQSADGYKTPSGSPLMGFFQALIRAGHEQTLIDALHNNQPITVEVTSLSPADQELLKAMAQSEVGLKEFERLGITTRYVDGVLMSLDVPVKLGVYNHIVWGITKEGNLAMLRTSGLLNGSVSSKSGITIEGLARLCQEVGFMYTMLGSQGRDVPQVLKNGELVVFENDPTLNNESVRDKLLQKEATTPSIFVVVPK